MKRTLVASTWTWTPTCWGVLSLTTVKYVLLTPFSTVCQHTQIVISTGKSDWERDITDDRDSLAAALLEVTTSDPKAQPTSPTSAPPTPASTPRPMTPSMTPSIPASPMPASPPPGKGVRPAVTGLFHTSDSKRTSVLNGSHKTLSHEDDHESVLVFPDFQVVTEVRRSVQGAHELWESAVDPEIGRDGSYLEKSILKTWVLPYSCVILLCESVHSTLGKRVLWSMMS